MENEGKKQQKIKVLFVCSSVSMGGANQSLVSLIDGLMYTESVDIKVFIPQNNTKGAIVDALVERTCAFERKVYTNCVSKWEKDEKIKGLLRYVLNILRYIKTVKTYKEILEEVRLWNPDIIHTNSSVCDLGARLAHDLCIPHVWHVRETLVHYSMVYLFPHNMKQLVKETAKIIYISDFLRKNRRDMFDSERSAVVYNGFRTDIVKRRAGRPKGEIKIFLAGTVTESKGQMDAIEALGILASEYRMTNMILLICGIQSTDTVYVTKLKGRIDELGIAKQIDFIPFRTDIDSIRAESDIALQCSILEGLGRVTIEAMLSKVLVIGADSGATSELVDDGRTGFLYPPRNAKALADVIYKAVNESEYEKIVDRAYEWARGIFDYRAISKEVLQIYEGLMGNGHKSEII